MDGRSWQQHLTLRVLCRIALSGGIVLVATGQSPSSLMHR